MTTAASPEIDTPSPARPILTWLLLALTVALPFEAKLFRLGSLVITLPEFLIYALIASWLISIAVDGPRSIGGASKLAAATVKALSRDRIARAVTLWIAVSFASAAVATSHREEALKFSLRAFSGVLLYFAARDLVRPPAIAKRIVAGILVGAVASSACTFLESLWPNWSAWWAPFRPQEFFVSRMARASGTFAFPNIAAMYWEAALPLCFLIAGWHRTATTGIQKTRVASIFLVVAILLHGIVATATRASIFGVAFIAGSLVLIGYGRALRRVHGLDRSWASFGGAILIVELISIVLSLRRDGTGVVTQRLMWWRDQGWYQAGIPADVERDSIAPPPEAAHMERVIVSPTAISPIPSRRELWRAAVTLWTSHPILGVGPDNFRHRYFQVIHPDKERQFGDQRIHANNLYFETLADTGLLGSIALGLLILGLARAGVVALRGPDTLAMVALLGVLAFLIHGTVDYFLEFTPTFSLWWILVALAGGARSARVPSESPRRIVAGR